MQKRVVIGALALVAAIAAAAGSGRLTAQGGGPTQLRHKVGAENSGGTATPFTALATF